MCMVATAFAGKCAGIFFEIQRKYGYNMVIFHKTFRICTVFPPDLTRLIEAAAEIVYGCHGVSRHICWNIFGYSA